MTCLVLSSSAIEPRALEEIRDGLRPRQDYLEIACALGADVLDTSVAAGIAPWRRKLERVLASDLTQASAAWRGRRDCGAWLSTSEKVGLPLALRGCGGPPHILIAHNLDTGKKRGLHALTGVLNRFAGVVCLSQAQAQFLRDTVKLPPERVHFVWDNVDDKFFRPEPGAVDGEYILAVGRENRDYATLIEAARITKLQLIIIAGSLWSSRSLALGPGNVPPNVTVRGEFVPYTELRTLYAGARFVAVPLRESRYAAGVNGVLEAMAMGKASVVTRSPGLRGYLDDGVTNLTVPAGDPEALAGALFDLWNSANARQAMGHAAYLKVQENMSMDAYVQSIMSIVQKATGGN